MHFQSILKWNDRLWEMLGYFSLFSMDQAFNCTARTCKVARFSDLHVNSIMPLPTSRADLEPPKGLGWG